MIRRWYCTVGRNVAKKVSKNLPILSRNDNGPHESRTRGIASETFPPGCSGNWWNKIRQFWNGGLRIYESSVLDLRGRNKRLESSACCYYFDNCYVRANELFRWGKCRACEKSMRSVREQTFEETWSVQGRGYLFTHILVGKIFGHGRKRGS